jgi:hypothetical protein
MIHGVYHIFALLGYSLIAEGFFEPLSAIILILFAILMIRMLYPNSLALLRKHKDDFNYI